MLKLLPIILHNNFNGAVVVATDGKIDYLSGIGIAEASGHQNKSGL
jgi:hypothetical protein